MKPLVIILSLLFIIKLNSFSQEYDPYTYQDIKPKKVLSEKVFFGGGFGLQFGTYTKINFNPEIGVRPTQNIELGIAGYYMYYNNSIWNFSDHIYGGSVFTRIFVYNDIFIQGEYEILNVKNYDNFGLTGDRVYVQGVLGGIGYRQKIGKRSAILATVLYNFMIEEITPYYNPVFRISFIY